MTVSISKTLYRIFRSLLDALISSATPRKYLRLSNFFKYIFYEVLRGVRVTVDIRPGPLFPFYRVFY